MTTDPQQRVAWALAVLGFAESRLRKNNPGQPLVNSLSDIEAYEQAASRVIPFLLNRSIDVDVEAVLTDDSIDELLDLIGQAAAYDSEGHHDQEMGKLPTSGSQRNQMRAAVRSWLRDPAKQF